MRKRSSLPDRGSWPGLLVLTLLLICSAGSGGCSEGTTHGDDDASLPATSAPCEGEGCGSPTPTSSLPPDSPPPTGAPTDSPLSTEAPTESPGSTATPTSSPSDVDFDEDGYSVTEGDCLDTDAAVHPGAAEVCNGLDDDCDTSVDEGFDPLTSYEDGDLDTFGSDEVCATACQVPAGCVIDHTDCDDTDSGSNPAAGEVCDGADNDCDGQIDEGVSTTWYGDLDADGFGLEEESLEACTPPDGYAAEAGDCDDTDAAVHPGAEEVPYNGVDDDCRDGDEVDVDGDGYDSVEVEDGTDCDDQSASSYPGADEFGDGKDNDCDGQIDEDLDTVDDDGDGYTEASEPLGDCDDADDGTYPGAAEVCDGKNNDCDDAIDEDLELTWYLDADGDGYGDSSSTLEACAVPDGYVADADDCDDGDAGTYPGALEVCDGVDNDCDGEPDEGALVTYYRDMDGDGYGVAESTLEACSAPTGYAALEGDCNDNDGAVNPDGTEICNGADDDCDGMPDDDVSTSTYYVDADGDGFGTASEPTLEACAPPDGYSLEAGDCDDGDAAVNPGAAEVCDEQDNDCNGAQDETCWDVARWDEGLWGN